MRVKFTIALCALLVLALGASQAYAQGYLGLEKYRNGCSTRKEPDGGSTSSWTSMWAAVISMPEPPSPSPLGAFRSLGPVLRNVQDGGLSNDSAALMALKLRTMRIRAPERSPSRPAVHCGRWGNDQLDRYQSGRFQSGCGRRNYRHHLLHGPYRFDSHRPVETRKRRCSGGRGQGRSGRWNRRQPAGSFVTWMRRRKTPMTTMPDIPVGGIPMITVTEGFNNAWEAERARSAAPRSPSRPSICLREWSCGFRQTVTFVDPDDANATWATLTLSGENRLNVVVDEEVEDNDRRRLHGDLRLHHPRCVRIDGCDGFLRNRHNGRHRRH